MAVGAVGVAAACERQQRVCAKGGQQYHSASARVASCFAAPGSHEPPRRRLLLLLRCPQASPRRMRAEVLGVEHETADLMDTAALHLVAADPSRRPAGKEVKRPGNQGHFTSLIRGMVRCATACVHSCCLARRFSLTYMSMALIGRGTVATGFCSQRTRGLPNHCIS